MKKTALLLLGFAMIATTAYAGGSIFGGHKHKTSNPNGVYSIGLHICSSLECPQVRIIQGKCTGDHMSKHWGVCVCDEGYEARNNVCVLEGKCPDGSDPQIKTYQDGECCSVWHTVEYCPGDPLPTCTREASCDYDEGTCSENSGSYAEAYSSEGHICCLNSNAECPESSGTNENCTCVPKGADDDQWSCGQMVCRTCAAGERANCSPYGDCICVPKNKEGGCGFAGCILCNKDEVAVCDDISYSKNCVCVPEGQQGKCNYQGCVMCPSDAVITGYCSECPLYCATEASECMDDYCCNHFGGKGDWCGSSYQCCASGTPICIDYQGQCMPEGSTIDCVREDACKVCSATEGVAHCPGGSHDNPEYCVCVPEGYRWTCSGYECGVCSPEQGEPICPPMGGSCICVPEGHSGKCSNNYCISCDTNEVAKCAEDGVYNSDSCTCVPNSDVGDETKWKCSDSHCIYCPTGTAICDGEDGACRCSECAPGETQYCCGDTCECTSQEKECHCQEMQNDNATFCFSCLKGQKFVWTASPNNGGLCYDNEDGLTAAGTDTNAIVCRGGQATCEAPYGDEDFLMSDTMTCACKGGEIVKCKDPNFCIVCDGDFVWGAFPPACKDPT